MTGRHLGRLREDERRSVTAFSVFLETPGLRERYSDFMYTKQLLKKRKERLCFKQ